MNRPANIESLPELKTVGELRELLEEVWQLIEQTPNDMELGGKIRQIYHQQTGNKDAA